MVLGLVATRLLALPSPAKMESRNRHPMGNPQWNASTGSVLDEVVMHRLLEIQREKEARYAALRLSHSDSDRQVLIPASKRS